MPFSTATPKKLMKPTEAGTLRYSPVSQRATIPPIIAKGRFMMISAAWRTELKEANNRKKINPIVIGRMI